MHDLVRQAAMLGCSNAMLCSNAKQGMQQKLINAKALITGSITACKA
jgi:hypothetical protein